MDNLRFSKRSYLKQYFPMSNEKIGSCSIKQENLNVFLVIKSKKIFKGVDSMQKQVNWV